MIIKKISILNLDKLTETYKIGQDTPEFKKFFSSHLTALLNHIQINFVIDNLSILEYYFMKKISTSISSRNKMNCKSFIDPDKSPEKYGIVKKLSDIEDCILTEDIRFLKDIPSLLPIGYFSYDDVNVSFSGQDILMFSNGYIESFINNLADKPTEEAENFLIKTLIEKFYAFMTKNLSEYDLLTDFAINKFYYNYIDYNQPVKLAEVICPGGILQFFGNGSKTLDTNIAIISEFKKNHKNDWYNYISYHFVMNTDFYTFLMLNQYTDFIKDTQPFKILLGQESDARPPYLKLTEDIVEKYGVRLSSVYKDYTNIKNMVIKDPSNNIMRYNYILSNQKIKYTINFTVKELLDLINPQKTEMLDPCVCEIIKLLNPLIGKINKVTGNL